MATLQNPLDADSFVEDLRKFEPVLRRSDFEFLITQEPNKLKTRQDREQLADEIRLEMNDALKIDDNRKTGHYRCLYTEDGCGLMQPPNSCPPLQTRQNQKLLSLHWTTH